MLYRFFERYKNEIEFIAILLYIISVFSILFGFLTAIGVTGFSRNVGDVVGLAPLFLAYALMQLIESPFFRKKIINVYFINFILFLLFICFFDHARAAIPATIFCYFISIYIPQLVYKRTLISSVLLDLAERKNHFDLSDIRDFFDENYFPFEDIKLDKVKEALSKIEKDGKIKRELDYPEIEKVLWVSLLKDPEEFDSITKEVVFDLDENSFANDSNALNDSSLSGESKTNNNDNSNDFGITSSDVLQNATKVVNRISEIGKAIAIFSGIHKK